MLPEPHDVGPLVERAHKLAHQISRVVPGASCLHRAGAARVWLASHGVDAQIIVGMRKAGDTALAGRIEGHAWLEVDTPSGTALLFTSENDAYTPVWGGS